ncbi:MAG: Asp-tRNA(Asn)/Glu-tRNA(Gln) amidotransferase subunit GatC [Betaproteobacteria bacterium]|nr:Asp-tRNA(Asn)/Glu-tRNA(Gln) amidotransferase subunit GatC [Betaproteobacteria bacterium]
MSLKTDDVLRIARLARLEIGAEEAVATLGKLNGIFALIERMQAVDTTGVEPLYKPQATAQRLRDDSVTESDRRDVFQAVAPQSEDGLYLVPKVIE